MELEGRNFIRDITSFIFIEDEPEKADIIFVPGGSWPEPTEKAAKLWIDGYAPFINSRCVTEKNNLDIKKAIICCKSFHAKRCLMFYSFAYPKTKFIVCPADIEGIAKDNWFTTELGIDTVMGELSRVGGQLKKAIPTWILCE